ncbi:fibrillin-2-like [Cimex lectularius]|uniref:Fibrillin n=1 Tax=Cimex lectularius TaxID=79782 RepID=A0A8I6TCQ2_CIMLE|nr:fibrillin-2-like [Cimex lectularius]
MWFILLLFGLQYSGGSQNLANPSLPLPIGGPNVCGPRNGRTFCCPGWQIKINTGLCIVPQCGRKCGRGRCVKPNRCMCENGHLAPSCLPFGPHNDTATEPRRPSAEIRPRQENCRYPCMNGGKCVGTRCSCKHGYEGDWCEQAICKEPCLNGGRCIAPDTCGCIYGYTGKRCEADYRTGPCYTKVVNGMCQAQLQGVVCTRNLCCATVGKAWGHPCEMCPHNLPCDEGYLQNIHSGMCVDINECEAIPGLCIGGKCVNTMGSFKCQCPVGQARDEETNMCRDVNECKSGQALCENGRCVNTDGSYYCLCNPGFIANRDNTGCIDARQDYCYTTVSRSGVCQQKLSMRLSKRDCCCGMNMGQAWGHNCDLCPIQGESKYKALCGGGGNGSGHGNGGNGGGYGGGGLVLVDECGLRPDICGGGSCQDTPEAYTCTCYPGYRKGQSQVCEDVDECQLGYCYGGRCFNSPGSFECTCPPGFDVSSDGKRCIDHDECTQNGMCANGFCINMDGSFKCQCKDGFVLSATGHSCIDTDECLENPRICLNGRCENTPGSYRCICQSGFTLSADGSFCMDTDECSKSNRMCDNGKCINMEGTYKCLCDSGFKASPSQTSCVDIDECQSPNPPCGNGRCRNTIGSFYCECNYGFNLGPDGRTCVDTRRDLCYATVQEGKCANPSTTPVSKSSCCCCVTFPNQPMAWGSSCQICPQPNTEEFRTLCPHGPGMTNAGIDINECSQNPNICQNGACENLMGSHRCICNPGFESDVTGKACVDIDECKTDDNICMGGQCRNTPGSFQCICPSGTQLNVLTHACEDVDECRELGSDACYNSFCINTVGSFICECEPGSILDHTGRACIDNRKGNCWTRLVGGRCENSLPQLTLKSECCCSVGLAWGSPCEPCHYKDCDCAKGYTKSDGKVCKDINECELNAGVCKGGGTCVNTDGSFTCVCLPGLTLDSTGTMCIDMRQESCFTDYKHGQGVIPIEGVYPKSLCCCSKIGKAWGGSSDGDRCESCPKPGSPTFTDLCPKGQGFVDKKDINECMQFPSMCSNGRCKNTMGGFNCRCNQGYALDDTETKCVDIDECSIMHGVCGSGTCQNLPGSFECQCKEGFESSVMMKVCMDINECETIPGLCKGGVCRNTPGSFKCVCPPGHELSPDKRYCKDIDECSRTSGICSNGVCENMMGTYQCVCDDGYEHAGITSHCEDIDECANYNGGCSSICQNAPGSFSCTCQDGFVLKNDGRTCVDIDECAENSRICNGGKCTNTIGSFKCDCIKGLLPGPEGSSCVDINECEDHPNICGNGDCDNTIGSFRCHCEVGYSAKPYAGPYCTDDDECYLMTHNCDMNADCINNPGSYICRCRDGFIGDGINCVDINECSTNNGGCSQNAKCRNTEGSFDCECEEGFRGDGFSCVDIDECSEHPMYCENGHCLNQPGSYKCECEMGFMHPDYNGKACIDMNECNMFNNICMFGQCENIFGMFKCNCDEGYTLGNRGDNCTDINECENPGACRFGTCENTNGSYLCNCPPNHQLTPSKDGCVDKRESRCYQQVDGGTYGKPTCTKDMGQIVTKATCCCSIGKGWGPNCELCPTVNSPAYRDLCPGGSGYRPNLVTVDIEDINECDEHPRICQNGHCTNSFGSFICSCNDGFRLDETTATCLDIDECNETPNICGAGYCVNDDGTFHCICPDGYMLLPNGKECVDMRKEYCYMEYSHGKCEHPMSNQQTKMVCCCSMGQAWGHPCKPCPVPKSREYIELCGTQPGQIINPMTNQTEEIDECKLMPTMCKHGDCMNTPGSFECDCNNGFSYDINSHQCVDENECLRSPSPCRGNAQCVNSQGSYECQCPDGYKLGVSLRDCIDIDECIERPEICGHGTCNNFQGSFQCVCYSGYTLTPSRSNCVDIDECIRHPNICNNGTCSNSKGSYTCHCHQGFKLSHNNDCIDIDECHSQPYLCRNGRCKNTIGSFKCECTEGHELQPDAQQCRDVDECREMPGICPPPGRCQNTMGSFFCTCPPGYHLSPDKKLCLDIDECAERKGVCDGGRCINTDGGVICECPPGFIFSEGRIKCIDIRQEMCFENLEKGRCTNPRMEPLTIKECCCSMGMAWGRHCERCPVEGSDEFLKLCPQGIGRKESGEDLNECHIMPNACGSGDCINTDGSYRCTCPPGYVLDSNGKNCIDENECETSSSMCGNGTCTNIEGSFECSCNHGFAPGPMQTCEDINECQEMSNQCAFRCHNVPGSFRCICPYGYMLAPDGRHCQDVDECSTPANNCKFKCKNQIGSFICICPEGYTQIPLTDDCKDIDECQKPGVCDNGYCENLEGSFRCTCFPGFKPNYDFTKCIDERQGVCYRQLSANGKCTMHTDVKHKATKADCCCTMGAAWGPTCERCPQPGSDEYTNLCMESGISIDGQDIDECRTIPDLCKHGTCINTLGSYKCMCHKGFKADHSGTVCRDVNECHNSPSPCQHSCQNTQGSYLCSCPKGYELGPDGSSCHDIDECKTGIHICQQNCINTPGSYQCSCAEGYRQEGDYCLDIDECKNSAVCHAPGKCINTLGSYRCLCPKGFKLDSTGSFCRDADECQDDSKCEHGCQNIFGSYRCSCPKGFYKHMYYNHCIDENECLKSPCGTSKCFNTIGSYKCGCSEGFQFDQSISLCVQLSPACADAQCAFGCFPGHQGGYSCGCPTGFQQVGQGHCMQTINSGPNFSPQGFQKHYSQDPYRVSPDKVISTEGCFSCKTNGRHRRTTNTTNVQKERHYYRHVMSRRTKNGPRPKRHHMSNSIKGSAGYKNGQNIKWIHEATVVTINLSQTKHRMKIIKLIPAVENDFEYEITQGNEKGTFDLVNKHGVWALHFKKRLKQPTTFYLEITGKPRNSIPLENTEQPLVLHIRLIVSS